MPSWPLQSFRSLHPLQRLALVLWTGLIVGICARVAILPANSGTVVNIYLNAAERWQAGRDIYQWQIGLDLYRNPPAVTPLFVPLTYLPPKVAGLLWRLVSVTALLLGLRAFLRHGMPFVPTAAQRGTAFALAVPLGSASLSNGQTNLFLAGLLLLGSAAVARGSFRAGGLWLAAAAGIKFYPAAVGLLLAAAYPRRFLPWFLVGLLAYLAYPLAFTDADYLASMYRSFADSIRHDDRTFAPLGRAPQDAYMLLRVWATAPDPATYRAVQLGVAAGMAGLMLLTLRRGHSRATLAALALHLGCTWMTAFGPASEGSTYTLLAATGAVILVLANGDRRTSGGRVRFVLALAAWGLLNSPVLRDAFPKGGDYRILGPLPAGALLLMAVVVWQALRQPAVAGIEPTANESPRGATPGAGIGRLPWTFPFRKPGATSEGRDRV